MSAVTPPAPGIDKPTLLFIDDEPAILAALRIVFRSTYQVVTTTDPGEALALLRQRDFDVVVSDQRMPRMQGVELLHEARSVSPHTTRILLTGYSDAEAMVGAINEGEVYRFAHKPWDNAQLKGLVDEAIEVARQVRRPELPEAVPSAAAAAGDAAEPRQLVVVLDGSSKLYAAAKAHLGEGVDLRHAPDLGEVVQLIEQQAFGVLVCALDAYSQDDSRRLHALKRAYPHLLVIAVCDCTDSDRLVELINHAKIFRFVKKPVPWALLSRYVASALAQLAEVRRNPALLCRQAAAPMEGALALQGAGLSTLGAAASPAAAPGRSFGATLARLLGFGR
ncbi:response regulator [Aquabacterium sp. A7-Y]|uniref:response regulator n=1 Tax=Aquabacterium sp. A7-Y TaxID=1349605 RepID=UPI00223D9AE8|nr:response regulator [Aquabacterium sp. A7-Y]MCW7541065.1 response regulator [Aquabacterium sp. A7-Y]